MIWKPDINIDCSTYITETTCFIRTLLFVFGRMKNAKDSKIVQMQILIKKFVINFQDFACLRIIYVNLSNVQVIMKWMEYVREYKV